MAKAIVVEDHQLNHAINVAKVSSPENSTRDAALLLCCFGTGLKPTEIAQLLVSDYLNPDGSPKSESNVRPEIAFNGRARPLHWVNKKLISGIDDHLLDRLKRGHGVTAYPSAYRGLDPLSGLLLSGRTGQPLKLSRQVKNGRTYYAAEQLSALITKLFRQSGIEGASALSGRRTMAVKLKRQGIDERHIGEILGVSSLKAVKAICETDPVRLSDLIKRVI